MTEREKLLRQIMSFDFAAHDMHLYLNTHPNDQRAIQAFNSYVETSKTLKSQYQKTFGPLTVDNAGNSCPWTWIKEPWPWQGM